jgi:formylglycine-generating enzyme required for sulfatase activity
MDVQSLLPESESEVLAPDLATIPAGWFLMGCNTGQDCERPAHRVWIDEFLLAKRQVTNADYARFLRQTAPSCSPPPFWDDPAFDHPEQPVVGVSWHDAMRYCAWLSSTRGMCGADTLVRQPQSELTSGGQECPPHTFRLPTEAEWERAARGGSDGALYPWGDAPPQSLPDYAKRCAEGWKIGPELVGLAQANAYGLFNMCDNVHEWCSDWYAADYYAVSPERNPRGPETGKRRASRGGSWRHHIKISRCAARSSIPPEFKYADYGFRVACDVS